MKARIEKVSIYYKEDIMLIAPDEEMFHFAISMACAMREAAENAEKESRIHTASSYKRLANTFSKIAHSIK